MTLPALISNYRDKLIVIQVKKTYSELQNALKMYAAKNDCSDISCIYNSNDSKDDITKKLYEQFKGAKYCTTGSKDKLCKSYNIKGNTPVNNGYGTVQNADGFLLPFFIAANGATYHINQYNTCIYDYTYNKKDENGYYIDEDNDGEPDTYTATVDRCATFYFDANGPLKGPNQFGADVYNIQLKSTGKFVPDSYLLKTLSTEKINYTPHNIGDEIK